MIRRKVRLGWFILLGLAGLLAIGPGLRAWDAASDPALRPWHTEAPPEPGITALDAGDWRSLLASEERAFAAVERAVSARLAPDDRGAVNRYDPASPLHAPGFAADWNRSFVLAPGGVSRGAALEDAAIAAPDRLVLVSPMIGVKPFARFAGIAGWPAVLPAFAGAAWLSVLPGFNPFKFN